MFLIGLTGGIGAGKSTVAALLAELGAQLVDADQLAREVVESGTPGLAAIVAEFGADVLKPNGELDRSALAELVFADSKARNKLNSITHPLVAKRFADIAAAAPTDAVLVHDVPLLVENRLHSQYDLVMVVWAPWEQRVARLARTRGLDPEQVKARAASQASDAQRAAVADVIITNDGSLIHLAEQVQKAWRDHVVPALPA